MMRDEALKKRIHQEMANATVKVLVADEFQGSGVFITPDGYVLTAYHCIGEYPPAISIETCFGERFNAELDEAKSLKHPDYDIAVLKIYEQTAHCLPLGTITSQDVTDEVVAMGYPAGDKPEHKQIGIFFSQISQIRTDHKIQIPNAIKGRGQSGGPVYHYATQRLIGLAVEGYEQDVIMDTGLATCFDALFEKWPELENINNQVAQAWEKRLLNEVAPQTKYKRNIDDLRPHLPNRRPQERKLGQAIQAHHDKHRPLFCLIHSDECQCSDRFVDRLVQYYLPQVVPGDGITSHFVHCHFSEGIELHQEISEQLASKLGINPFAPSSEIVEAIMRERSPILFHTDICTKHWSQCGGMKVIHDFIEFWAKLELPSTHHHLLLICLYFNYKDTKPAHFFTRWFKQKSINEQIRKEFEQLENKNFLAEFGINGVVLPELVDIEKEDVDAWAREHLRSVLDIVRPKINNLFKSPEQTIPMCDLATELREILEEFSPEVFRV